MVPQQAQRESVSPTPGHRRRAETNPPARRARTFRREGHRLGVASLIVDLLALVVVMLTLIALVLAGKADVALLGGGGAFAVAVWRAYRR
ncbi:hypothetical protein [Nocardia vinacea]|uniref:hypothetical protein n=1 Tax=Nocardia vinacea TaxID=96468 RepID=UPI0012F6B644|nr:hypothetical protein [Nocardia vinacea]